MQSSCRRGRCRRDDGSASSVRKRIAKSQLQPAGHGCRRGDVLGRCPDLALASCATSRWRIKGHSEPDRPPRDVSGARVASPRGGASNRPDVAHAPVKGSLRNRRKRMASATAPTSRVKTVIRVTSGNFLEMFDFFLFGFYATYISKAFFPSNNEAASLMLTLMTFGAGFLMRPLGAIFLGAYVDRVGRRMGLIVTLTIMASGTILIAFVPGYATI